MSRLDAWAKASGEARYVADIELPGMLHVALVRGTVQHGRISRVDSQQARAIDGVVGIFTAHDVSGNTYGRSVRDIPILAREKVRFVGERVAAVVAESRRAAEKAAALVEVEYDDLPAATSAEEAIAPGAPLVHDEAWAYPGAAIRKEDGQNLQSLVVHGQSAEVEAALAGAEHVVDRTYSTPAVHQAYLEPQSCVAAVEDGRVRLWVTNKSPYRLRSQLAACLDLDPASIEIEPVLLGGDFGGKGSPMDAPLCIGLSRLVGRPVKLVLRYVEDLTSANPRHPARIRVRAGCDREGRLTGMAVSALLNGGAYGGFKPLADVNLHGIADCAMAYRVPALSVESTIAYTNTVPKGHMRSPGAPQAIFAVESALDELAAEAGLDPVDLRRHNLVRNGEPDGHGKTWAEARGLETLEAAVKHGKSGRPEVPPGWRHGEGVAVYVRGLPGPPVTSVRLVPVPDDRVRVEVPIPETGTGSHTMVRNRLAVELGIDPEQIEVVQVSTEELPIDPGVGGSRVTVGMSEALSRAAKAWRRGSADEPVVVELRPEDTSVSAPVVSYCVQVAQVAVDPPTGQVKVLEILSAVDVGDIINPAAHQMQIDGGAVMGYGFACMEDLLEEDGQVWAANLGEFKIPSTGDIPCLRTVLVEGGQGVSSANVKPVGELSNVPTAAAIANAVAVATGARIRDLPITSEKVFLAIEEASQR